MGSVGLTNWPLAIIIILTISSFHCSESKRLRTVPKTVAQRTGAARFEEYLDEDFTSSREGKLQKRLAIDPDVDDTHDNDFEIYQGVLGRPGVDFPVLTGIPRTSFTCNNFGNGYFADLETGCQVFHICEEGRKISFLCPNGTIFRQIDLICDWWFKVDCNSAPSHYAESSEQLQRAQRLRQQKLRHVVKSDLLTSSEVVRHDARTSESVQKPQVKLPLGRGFQARPTAEPKTNRRIDLKTDEFLFNSRESLNSDPVTPTKRQRKGRKESLRRVSHESGELVDTAESAAALHTMNSNLNGYSYPAPQKNGYEYPIPDRTAKKLEIPGTPIDFVPAKQKKNFYEPKPFNTRPTEKSKIFSSTIAKLEVANPEATLTTTTTPASVRTTVQTTTSAKRGSTTYQSSLINNFTKTQQKQVIQNKIQTSSNAIINNEFKTTTPSYDIQHANTYSTARRPQSKTRETPFYTPTIPTVTSRQSKQVDSEPSTEAPILTTTPTITEVSKHAEEMMEILRELNIEPAINQQEIDKSDYESRAGIEVPPSSGPNALHSLALYFANSDSNAIKRMTTITTPEPVTTEEISKETAAVDISTIFLSNHTVSRYDELFKDKTTTSLDTTTAKYEPVDLTTTQKVPDCQHNDLETQHSKNPIISAAGTPQLRELAQVFTHALSAYLQDPETFRKILSEIRPTEPPSVQSNEIFYNNGKNSPFSDRYTAASPSDKIVRQESQFALPQATTSIPTTQTDEFEVLDFSDVTSSTSVKEDSTTIDIETTTEPFVTTTSYPINSETFPSLSANLIDKTPGSRLIAGSENERQGKQLDKNELDTSPFHIPVPDEINGGLSEATEYPFEESTENGTDYFPPGNLLRVPSKLDPYGFDVKPVNSSPISETYPTALSDTQAIPLRWGDEITTEEPPVTHALPTVYQELVPPLSQQNKSQNLYKLPSNEILPPSDESQENLQHAQSQSIVSGQNNIYSDHRGIKSYYDYLNYDTEVLFGTTKFGEKIQGTTEVPETTTFRGHYVTKEIETTTTPSTTTDYNPTVTSTQVPDIFKTTLPDTGRFNTNSKTTLSYAVLLDPFTINDGLMAHSGNAETLASNFGSFEDKTVTPSPNTYLPRSDSASTETTFPETGPTTLSTPRKGKSFSTTPLAVKLSENYESEDPMQQRANEMFGSLNETQVSHLMNVMKKADNNKTVRRLILLLIQTCDDDYSTTVEESRNALLNALIKMDENTQSNDFQIVNTYSSRKSKSLRQTTTTTTTTELPITTYKSVHHNRFVSSAETASSEATTKFYDSEENLSTTTPTTTTIKADTTTTTVEATTISPEISTEIVTEEIPTTTTILPTTTTIPTTTPSRFTTQSQPKFRLKSNLNVNSINNNRKAKNTNGEFSAEQAQSSIEHKHADARALELLRSLYSIASRFG